jgi:hypothetical protein
MSAICGAFDGARWAVFRQNSCQFVRILALAILELLVHLAIELVVRELIDATLKMLLLSLLVPELLQVSLVLLAGHLFVVGTSTVLQPNLPSEWLGAFLFAEESSRLSKGAP